VSVVRVADEANADGKLDVGSGHDSLTLPIITTAKIEVTTPGQVTQGSKFKISWFEAIDARDFVTIVPAGTEEGEHGDYIRVGDHTSGTLTAPAKPGMYEVRYIQDNGRATLGRATMEVTETGIDVSAPDQVTQGSTFKITWSDVINPRDFVTIVPAGTEEGKHGDYLRVHDHSEGKLTAPAEPGLYEVRYVLVKGRLTQGKTTIEVTEAGIDVSAPDQVTQGSTFKITWSDV